MITEVKIAIIGEEARKINYESCLKTIRGNEKLG